jgi:hydroxymethylpyrimidine/phosphomethylpyrimidine kinase
VSAAAAIAIPNVLSIAGSDPSGGAGIQADLKTFSALGAYGMAVITALTAQSTTGVTGVHAVPAAWVTRQIDTLAEDVRVDAVKIGMLGDAAVVAAVADALERHRFRVVVLDTVMVSKSGHRLLREDAVDAVRTRLLPLVDLITPNVPEAADLLEDAPAVDEVGTEAQARRLLGLGARRVLLKGGHLADPAESVDLLAVAAAETAGGDSAGPVIHRLVAPRVVTTNDHGTGCTLSSAIAALRPQRPDWLAAITDAKAYLTGALAATDRPDVGSGHGPVHHFWALWPAERSGPSCRPSK